MTSKEQALKAIEEFNEKYYIETHVTAHHSTVPEVARTMNYDPILDITGVIEYQIREKDTHDIVDTVEGENEDDLLDLLEEKYGILFIEE